MVNGTVAQVLHAAVCQLIQCDGSVMTFLIIHFTVTMRAHRKLLHNSAQNNTNNNNNNESPDQSPSPCSNRALWPNEALRVTLT